MAQTVIGMFDNATDAQQAVEQLVNKGFSRDNIDVTSRNIGSGSSTDLTGSSSTGATDVSGDYTGGNLSGSGYAGTGAGSLSTDLSSGKSGSNTLSNDYSEHKGSAIGNFFRSLFGDDNEADTYSSVAGKTGSIVTVHAKSAEEAEDAADILDDAGAVDVNERASQYGYSKTSDYGSTGTGVTNVGSDISATTESNLSANTGSDVSSTAGTSIPIIEEQLQVGKKTVETGGKRLRSRIVERPVEESLRLREERVWVERNTVDRPATEADLANFQQKEFELVEHAEVPVVAKEARVVEEVSLGKEVDERTETIRDTVRSTEVDVEDIENTNVRKTSGTTGTGYNTSGDVDSTLL